MPAHVTIADAKVTDGAPPAMPTNVSFSTQVFPIFSARGCVACHSGGGPGKDLGGLMLDGGANLAYKELDDGESAARAEGDAGEEPRAHDAVGGEPVGCTSERDVHWPQDPDYLKILVWIREGAKQN